MQKYNAVTAELLQKLNELLGEKYVATDPEKLDVYKTDEEANTHYHHMPEVVVFPENAEQIAGVMKAFEREEDTLR